MNLILYSVGYNPKNKQLDEYITKLVKKENPVFTYIPSMKEGSKEYFELVKTYYSSFGIENFNYLAIDSNVSLEDIEKAMTSDIIYLSGGNAFYFLKHIKESNFDKYLKKYAENGGLILGISAGANILTPSIIGATIPHQMIDRNEVKLVDLKGIGLVDFEFIPHYDLEEDFTIQLQNYSKQTPNVVYAAVDGSGIVYADGEIKLVGEIYEFNQGEILNHTSTQ